MTLHREIAALDDQVLPRERGGHAQVGGEIAVIHADRFMVSDELGDALPGTSHGFYASDTRFLSTYLLRLNEQRPLPLTARNVGHRAASFYATNADWNELEQGALSLLRDRSVDGALHDELVVTNHTGQPLEVALSLAFAADFLDIFEVRSLNPPDLEGALVRAEGENQLCFGFRQDGLVQHTIVSFSTPPRLQGSTAIFHLRLRPHEEWRVAIEVRARHDQAEVAARRNRVSLGQARSIHQHGKLRENAGAWSVPALETDDLELRLAFQRAVDDLRSLEMVTDEGHWLPAAGLPWYMAIFGRDSLITAFQTLMLGPELAVGTLHALAAYQATERDDFRDAEPGKMPHEIRRGRLARLGRVPHARYYGTVDATPLWLILLSETYRWTADLELVRSLLPAAEAALRWIDEYADLDGDGFVEYHKRSPEGLDNQGWKDSWDSIRFANGELAAAPIALAEVQGYVYDARLRAAEWYEALGQLERAAALRQQAARLKAAFDEAFWVPEQGFYALALDGRKRAVDSVTSNPGQALWSGIVDERRAEQVAERLLSNEMFSGWGMRTMSSAMGGYNPVSYHNGSVWPHDTALVAAGLARYGFHDHAARVCRSLIDASAGFPEHRLPELFAGYARRSGGFPVEYPAANAPQAWAAGGMVLALQTLLGIQPSLSKLSTQALPGAPTCTLVGVAFQGRRLTLRPSSEPHGIAASHPPA